MAVWSIYQEDLEKTICMAIAMYYSRFALLTLNNLKKETLLIVESFRIHRTHISKALDLI